MTWDDLCAVASELPSVHPGTYHGYPALRVGGKFLVRLSDDHRSVEFKGIAFGEREMLLATAPKVFHLPPGFNGQGVFARLSTVDPQTLRGLLRERWRAVAGRGL